MIELTFPFKNMAINDLLRLGKPGVMLDYIEWTHDGNPNAGITYRSESDLYRNALPNFENELLQVINTSDQATIDSYFQLLHRELGHIKNHLNKKTFEESVTAYNDRVMERFIQDVETASAEYFKQENRQLHHLETYEVNEYNFLSGFKNPNKTTKINYNYYCIESKPALIDLVYFDEYFGLLSKFSDEFFDIAVRYGLQWSKKEIVAKHATIKPVLYLEGELDIRYIQTAAKFLGQQDLLDQIELRQRGGYSRLDQMWQALSKNNWETIPQKKLLLYDCDTEKPDGDLGYIFKRVIPSIAEHPIKKGIENLFPQQTITNAIAFSRALVDEETATGLERGQPFTRTAMKINHQEKTNFCDWICESGTAEDFRNFQTIFDLIKTLLLE